MNKFVNHNFIVENLLFQLIVFHTHFLENSKKILKLGNIIFKINVLFDEYLNISQSLIEIFSFSSKIGLNNHQKTDSSKFSNKLVTLV